jgi:hypothetical protein
VNNAFMDREKQNALDLYVPFDTFVKYLLTTKEKNSEVTKILLAFCFRFLGYSQPQQGMLSVSNICGNEVNPDNEEHKRYLLSMLVHYQIKNMVSLGKPLWMP